MTKTDSQSSATRLWIWQTGANIGVFGSVLALFAGFDLTFYALLTGQDANASLVGKIGIALTMAFFPLLLFGGHCIDEIEKSEKSREAAAENEKPSSKTLYLRF